MDVRESRVADFLAGLGISCVRHEHPAAATVKEVERYWIDVRGAHCKNLFLRNWKGNRHYLLIAGVSTRIDLKELRTTLGEDRMGFASAERLMEHLGVEPGAVSPFGLINDPKHRVRVVIEEALGQAPALAFHPNINTVTLEIDQADFDKFLRACGHEVRWQKF